METQEFVKEVKVGLGVFLLGVIKAFFVRVFRGLTVLKNKLVSGVNKQFPADAVA